MATPAVQLPPSRQPAKQAGRRLFRKQVLPVGHLDVKGRKLDFTPKVLSEMVDTFKSKAMTQVPFVLADAENKHSDDPERFRGEVQALEATDEGLFATVETTERGAELLADNPKLPVSVRAFPPEQGMAGGKWVLGHVCGTLDEVAKGMGPWAAVEASAEVDVLDLSAEEFVPSGGVPHSEKAMITEDQTEAKDGQLSSDEVGAFRTFLAKFGGKDAAKPEAGKTDVIEPEATEPTDAEVERVLASILEPAATEAPVVVTDPAAEPVAATETDTAAVELANGRIATLESTLQAERISRAAERADADAQAYLEAGVPAAMVNLARPLLSQPSVAPIELSNGDKHDPQDTLRKVLDAAKGTVELSERGSVASGDSDAEQAKTWAETAEKNGGLL